MSPLQKILVRCIRANRASQHVLRRHVSDTSIVKRIQTQGKNGGTLHRAEYQNKTVVIEYSSPNIAKPFHVGHLRSTIIGNVIANLYEVVGWNVVRLNYLGDWGTQFGLMIVGFERYGDEDKLHSNPLHHLFEVYVKINADVKREGAENCDATYQRGMEVFRQLEYGDPEQLKLWTRFRDMSLKEYNELYQRLGVLFTEVHTESMYHQPSLQLIQTMRQDGTLYTDSEGKGCVSIDTNKGDNSTDKVCLLKSDGTTLYLTRDLAAIMDRYDKYKFDRIHYIVETGQQQHFQHMKGVLHTMPGWKERLNEDVHITFGRIEKMSTRQGKVVFLKDILNEAQSKMKETMLGKKSTKVDIDIDTVADVLGTSAVIVQDLSQLRNKNYKFTWDKVLSAKQDSGVFLQYCHARLCSIERGTDLCLDNSFNEEHLHSNTEAMALVQHLTRYDTAVLEAYNTLEPFRIVKYLCELCHLVNAAYRTCRVNNTDTDIGKAYLHLFSSSRITLVNGMTLLGLTPLDKM